MKIIFFVCILLLIQKARQCNLGEHYTGICEICPKGSFCNDGYSKSTCNKGNYCPYTGMSSEMACPSGHYCPSNGMIDPAKCNIGDFQSYTGRDYCSSCTAGGYCDKQGMTSPTPCPAGYYCPNYSTQPYLHKCSTGSYCPTGTGYELSCPPGHYCSIDTTTKYSCPKGSYCEGSGKTSITGECSPGYYCPKESISATQEPCPIGNMCPAGSGEPIKCEVGYFQNETIQVNCTICPVGQYCGKQGSSNGTICELGSYCPEGSSEEKKCDCSGNGVCKSFDDSSCECFEHYSSDDCSEFTCFGILRNESSVCNGNGYCEFLDECNCNNGYFGTQCEGLKCFGVFANDSSVCSGNGRCMKPDFCTCSVGFTEENCEKNMLGGVMISIGGVFAGLILLLVVVLVIISIPIFLSLKKQHRRLKEFSKYEDEISILKLEDQALKNSQQANFSISKKFLTVDQKDLHLKKRIGGGAFAEVFLCEWEGNLTALKLFQTSDVLGTENSFGDFEKELSFLSSISHPNIIQFHGCTLNPPRVGLILEFCEDGDLASRIGSSEKGWGAISFEDTCGWTSQIASAVAYIHKRNIIHRDLKLENVLLSKNICKLCDFGISKIIDPEKTLTRNVGTPIYIAPEIALGKKYDSKCDVYSLGIIMYQLLECDLQPYSFLNKTSFNGMEIKIAQKKIRPKINEKKHGKDKAWFIELIKRCWNTDPTLRPTMVEIQEIIKKNFDKKKREKETNDLTKKEETSDVENLQRKRIKELENLLDEKNKKIKELMNVIKNQKK